MSDRSSEAQSADPQELRAALARTVEALNEVRGRSREPIAIVGMGCRLPGGVDSPEALWELVDAGVDAIGSFPTNRGWNLEALYDPTGETPGTSYTREGGFIYDADLFDPAFFGIGPREALAMDPQQRLLLEVVWHALEHAGIDPHSLRETNTSLTAGIMYHDYTQAVPRAEAGDLDAFLGRGEAGSIATGRAAHIHGWHAAAVTIDTACSSSLVAVHHACNALRLGESDLALAGGSTVLSTPTVFSDFTRQQGLARDGRCKSFSAAADGTGWAEGAGILVLERLSDAQANGREVLAVIRGSAINHDGTTNGLTAPSGPAQERVITQALANAGLTPDDVDAIEAHGTGTKLGDPIEATALHGVFAGRPSGRPVRLGSIKSNMGHSQAAAGVAGVIKMVMALRHGRLPRTLHVDRPTPEVDWSSGTLELLTEPADWPAEDRPRVAGISSFGVGGTNSHVVIAEAPHTVQPAARTTAAPDASDHAPLEALPWLLSAADVTALAPQGQRLAGFAASGDVAPAEIARALLRRAQLDHRAVAISSDAEDLLTAARSLGEEDPQPRVVVGVANLSGRPVFVFPGQGSQWPAMGAELASRSEVFAHHLDSVDSALAPHTGWRVSDVVRGRSEAPSLVGPEIVQPALFAIMVALARTWEHFGVRPGAVIGHSQGEIAAAHIAGALSLSEAAQLIALRSRALSRIAGAGGMLFTALTQHEAGEDIAAGLDSVVVAALNAPRSTILSGRADQLASALTRCQERDVRARLIDVDYASHSPDIEALRDELMLAGAGIAPTEAPVPFYSALEGERIATSALTADYWYRNLRHPVLFEAATRALLKDGHRAFIEVSPHPVLSLAVSETIQATDIPLDQALVTGTLRRDHGGSQQLLSALGTTWTRGLHVDWERTLPAPHGPPPRLPGYPFQGRRYWLTKRRSQRQANFAFHPILETRTALAGDAGWVLAGRISLKDHPWLEDHRVHGHVIVPGTVLLELALSAARATGETRIDELTLDSPLVLDDGTGVELQVLVGAGDASSQRSIAIYSRSAEPQRDDAEWERHAAGFLAGQGSQPSSHEQPAPKAWPPADATEVALADVDGRLEELGLEYGPAFQGLLGVWRAGDDWLAEAAETIDATDADQADTDGFCIHPRLVDAALHPAACGDPDETLPRIPFTFSGVSVPSDAQASSRLRLRLQPVKDGAYSVCAWDADGRLALSVEEVTSRPASPDQLDRVGHPRAPAIHDVSWQAITDAPLPPPAVALAEGTNAELAEALRAGGVIVTDPTTPTESASADVLVVEPHRSVSGREREIVTDAAQIAARALTVLQTQLAATDAPPRTVLVTQSAIAAGAPAEENVSLAPSVVWGLARSAQSEHPGRVSLIDVDEDPRSLRSLAQALALPEPQIAIRNGILLVPRLRRADPPTNSRKSFGPGGTVLITGGTGGLGSLFARHLVANHGVDSLLLLSRSGSQAPGAEALRDELQALGAHRVTIAACDVSQRDQLERQLATISPDSPLRGVVHAAGLLDDALIESMEPRQLHNVLSAKAAAAGHLHELTSPLELRAFILFSSIGGILGAPGQGAYAAANTFLDALAAHRQRLGLPGLSLAWGQWSTQTGLTRQLADRDVARMTRAGVAPLSDEEGLALFDLAAQHDATLLITARLDRAALDLQARSGVLPAILSGLTRQRSAPPKGLRDQLAAAGTDQRLAVLGEHVRREIATILGHDSASAIDPDRPLKELGMESLQLVELRNLLAGATGLNLHTSYTFDHPTARALTAAIDAELQPTADKAEWEGIIEDVGRLLDGDRGDTVAARLQALLADRHGDGDVASLEQASDSELLAAADRAVAQSVTSGASG